MAPTLKLIKMLGFFQKDFPFGVYKFRHQKADYTDDKTYKREFWKLIYLVEGHGEKLINGRAYPMKPGSLFLIHPDDVTTFRIKSESIQIYNILFLPEVIGSGLRELKNDFEFFSIFDTHFNPALQSEHREQLYVLDSTRESEALIRRIIKEYAKALPDSRTMIRLMFQELLIMISRLSVRKIKGRRQLGIVNYVNSVIESHFQDEFDLAFLASKIGVTESHLCRLYKAETGRTVMEALLHKRLEEADKLLRSSPQKRICEICYECGFNDLSYFYRAFKSFSGVNPGTFRKKLGLH